MDGVKGKWGQRIRLQPEFGEGCCFPSALSLTGTTWTRNTFIKKTFPAKLNSQYKQQQAAVYCCMKMQNLQLIEHFIVLIPEFHLTP